MDSLAVLDAELLADRPDSHFLAVADEDSAAAGPHEHEGVRAVVDVGILDLVEDVVAAGYAPTDC